MISSNLVLALGVTGAHEVFSLKAGPRHFDLCRDQSYLSIKDQATRAVLLASWLDAVGCLQPTTIEQPPSIVPKRILIVGAGVAGVTMASELQALESNLHVDLIDSTGQAFPLQASCTTRLLSLTQYDWPAKHAKSHQLNVGRIVEASTCEAASVLAQSWRERLDARAEDVGANLADGLPNPCNVQARELIGPPAQLPDGRLLVRLKSCTTSQESSLEYDLVISAVGFGQETIPQRSGYPVTPNFWANDSVENTDYGGSRVVIVGLGDGAIQDFVRIVCKPGASILDHLGALLGAELLNKCADQLIDVDRQSILMAAWSAQFLDADNPQPHLAWASANVTCRLLAREALRRISAQGVNSVVRESLPESVVFVAPTGEPEKVYMLNRFFYFLLEQYFATERLASLKAGNPWMWPELSVETGTAVLSDTNSRGILVENSGVTKEIEYDHVIWRSGLQRRVSNELMSQRRSLGTFPLPYSPHVTNEFRPTPSGLRRFR